MAPPALGAPTATTGDADQIEQTRARLKGNVSDPANPGAGVQYYFEYGTTTGYGSQTSTEWDYGADGGAVSRLVEPLSAGTLYHYRVVAVDGAGTVPGEDKTFTTSAPPDRDGDGFPDNGDACQGESGVQNGYPGPGCPPAKDSDGDGYLDHQDPCPGTAGGAQGPYNAPGCPAPPDSDGDGYVASDDYCPDKPGVAQGPGNMQGCPAPGDSDGDGFPDYFGPPNGDECQNMPGPAAGQYNDNRRGCPERDQDGDGVPDHRDACPQSDQVNASKAADERGCPPFAPAFTIARWPSPAVKDFLKSGWAQNVFFGEGPRVAGKPFMRLKATMSLNAATTKQLKLKSSVIDAFSGQTPKASEDSEGGGRYVFPKFDIPAALKKKLAKLKRFGVTIKYVFTDAYDKKHSYTATGVIGSKDKPKVTPDK
jgi:hypothetical protein